MSNGERLAPIPGWKESTTTVQVFARVVEVPCWISEDGEIYMDGTAERIIERVKTASWIRKEPDAPFCGCGD